MTVPVMDGTPKRLLQQSIPPTGPATPDQLRSMIQTLMHEVLEAEFAQFLGAAPYERTGARLGVRNGTRRRSLVIRVGKLVLRVPRDRAGAFAPTVFVRYQRAEPVSVKIVVVCAATVGAPGRRCPAG